MRMPKVIWVVIACIGVLSGSGCGPPNMMKNAEAAYRTGNFTEALKLYRNLAEQGNAVAQYKLGYMYFLGQGTQKNDQEAARWTRRAAEQGHAAAQLSLGLMYKNGEGVAISSAEAVRWIRKAAEQGLPEAQAEEDYEKLLAGARRGGLLAQYKLGIHYQNSAQYKKAKEWFLRAAKRGHAAAQSRLGGMYLEGQDVPRDYDQAMGWFQKAARQEDVVAQANLGRMYQEGLGVPKNDAKAIRWYQKAADRGSAFAQDRMGEFHQRGGDVLRILPPEAIHTYTIKKGELTATFGDTTAHPQGARGGYSGCWRLISIHDTANAFRDIYAGLIYKGVRGGTGVRIKRLTSESVELSRKKEDGFHRVVYTLRAPYYIDIVCEWTPAGNVETTKSLVFASYISRPSDPDIYFRSGRKWHRASGMIYAPASSKALHEEGRDVVSGVVPVAAARFEEPFYYGLTRKMTLIFMFDNLEQTRFFVAPTGGGGPFAPAWDWVYRIEKPRAGKTYQFRIRIVYKPFVSPRDCRREYRRWLKTLQRNGSAATD